MNRVIGVFAVQVVGHHALWSCAGEQICVRAAETIVVCIHVPPSGIHSVVIDFIGYFNYVVPFLGEISDLAWAPMSAAAIYHLYGSAGAAGFGFVEELLPFTDFIPTATICWISRYLISPSRVDVDDVD